MPNFILLENSEKGPADHKIDSITIIFLVITSDGVRHNTGSRWGTLLAAKNLLRTQASNDAPLLASANKFR